MSEGIILFRTVSSLAQIPKSDPLSSHGRAARCPRARSSSSGLVLSPNVWLT